jgi:hypothetical protein
MHGLTEGTDEDVDVGNESVSPCISINVPHEDLPSLGFRSFQFLLAAQSNFMIGVSLINAKVYIS